ncbi:hypothetical protein IKQ74_01725 [Candidatus Saccharibacteria bacterium]|nr:hypothetical protein [Candidatus Saccharibacteria bacterium]
MKKLSLTAGVAAIALAVASIIPAAGAFAQTATTFDGNINSVTLKRTVSGVSNPVTNTFTYTITETSKPTGATSPSVPSSATIVFDGSETITNKSVEETTTIDLSALNYDKAGDYTWTIAETDSTDRTNYPIDSDSNNYTLQISVRYTMNGNTPTTAYTAYVTLKSKANNKVEPNATWGSTAARTYISATASTTGNMADVNECFAYTVNIPVGNGVVAGDSFTISSNSACTQTSATSVKAGTPATVYLKNGESLTVGVNNGANELPVGAKYTITKTNASDDYIEKMDGEDANTVTKTTVAVPTAGDSAAEAAFAANNHTDIENNKEKDPLTGIVTNYWFYLVLLIIGAFGLIVFMRKRQDDEEEQ